MATAPRPPDPHPRPGKANVGNRRTGSAKGTHSGQRRGQLPWRDDPLIVARVNLLRSLMAQGYTASQAVPVIGEFMAERGQLPASLSAVKSDQRRVRELQADERLEVSALEANLKAEHIEALREVKMQAWTAFHTAPRTSLNRSALLNTITRVEEVTARIDGALTSTVKVAGDPANPLLIERAIVLDPAAADLASELLARLDRAGRGEDVPPGDALGQGRPRVVDASVAEEA